MASRKVNGRMKGENGNGNKKSYQVRFFQKESSMLDKSFVRENLDFVRERLAARGGNYPLDELVATDTEWKIINLRSEELRRRRNEESETIGKLRRAGHDTSTQQALVN